MSEIDQLKDEIAAKVDNSGLGERELEQIVARSTVSVVDIPDELKENLALFLRLVRTSSRSSTLPCARPSTSCSPTRSRPT